MQLARVGLEVPRRPSPWSSRHTLDLPLLAHQAAQAARLVGLLGRLCADAAHDRGQYAIAYAKIWGCRAAPPPGERLGKAMPSRLARRRAMALGVLVSAS